MNIYAYRTYLDYQLFMDKVLKCIKGTVCKNSLELYHLLVEEG